MSFTHIILTDKKKNISSLHKNTNTPKANVLTKLQNEKKKKKSARITELFLSQVNVRSFTWVLF